MEAISLSNHSLRKKLGLSLTQMAVLCIIRKESENLKTNFYCNLSKKEIADILDVSEKTVFDCISHLKNANLITVESSNIRPTSIIYDYEFKCELPLELNDKKEKVESLHEMVIKDFTDYYKKEKGIDYVFLGGKDGNAAKSIINGLKSIVKIKDDENILKAFKISLLHLKGHWVYDNLSLSNYNSQINSIIDHTRKMIEQDKKPKSLVEKQRFNNSKEDTSFRRTSFTIK